MAIASRRIDLCKIGGTGCCADRGSLHLDRD
jgi:hypothetical protein